MTEFVIIVCSHFWQLKWDWNLQHHEQREKSRNVRKGRKREKHKLRVRFRNVNWRSFLSNVGELMGSQYVQLRPCSTENNHFSLAGLIAFADVFICVFCWHKSILSSFPLIKGIYHILAFCQARRRFRSLHRWPSSPITVLPQQRLGNTSAGILRAAAAGVACRKCFHTASKHTAGYCSYV